MSDTLKLRAVQNLEELIIYSSMNKEEEALSYIDDINEYIDKYTGWNLVEAKDSIEGYDYAFVTDRDGKAYICIDSVKRMLNSDKGIILEDNSFSVEDIKSLKQSIIDAIKSKIQTNNDDCSILVTDDDVISYADITNIIDLLFSGLLN